MLPRSLLLFAFTASLASGCAHRQPRPVATAEAPPAVAAVSSDWRQLVRLDDMARIDEIGTTWKKAIAEATKADPSAFKTEGNLLRPDAALPSPVPTPGLYRCRAIGLGLRSDGKAGLGAGLGGAHGLTRFKPFDCVVSAEKTQLGFTRVSGASRPGGYLWPDDEQHRMIFLGGTADREGQAASGYGPDVTRNRVGVFERIGEFRWRLLLLGRSTEPRLAVIELVPAVAIPIPARR